MSRYLPNMKSEPLLDTVNEIHNMVTEILTIQRGQSVVSQPGPSDVIATTGCQGDDFYQDMVNPEIFTPDIFTPEIVTPNIATPSDTDSIEGLDVVPLSLSIKNLLRDLAPYQDILGDVDISDDECSSSALDGNDHTQRSQCGIVPHDKSDDKPSIPALIMKNAVIPTFHIESLSSDEREEKESQSVEHDGLLQEEDGNNNFQFDLITETSHSVNLLNPEHMERDIFLSANTSLSSSLSSLVVECSSTYGDVDFLNEGLTSASSETPPYTDDSLEHSTSQRLGSPSFDKKSKLIGMVESSSEREHPELSVRLPSNGSSSYTSGSSKDQSSELESSEARSSLSGCSSEVGSPKSSSVSLEDFTDCHSSNSLMIAREAAEKKTLELGWMIEKIEVLLQSDFVINRNVKNIKDALNKLSEESVCTMSNAGL